MPACSKCGLLNAETARFCQSCGSPLATQANIPAYGSVPSATPSKGLTSSQKWAASIWAGILALAVLQAIDRAELASTAEDAVASLVGYAIGFVILYFVVRWLLERFFRESLPMYSPQG